MVNVRSTLLRVPALAAALFAGVPAGAADHEVVNTARAQWDAGGLARMVESNTVRLTVEEATRPAAPNIQIYQFQPGGPVRLAVDGTRCAARPDQVSSFAFGELAPATRFSPGTPLVLAIDNAAANRDPTVRERFTVVITSPAGDRESFSLLETAADSGRFAGVVPTMATPPDAVPADCVLSITVGEARLSMADGGGNSLGFAVLTTTPANVNVVFDSATGAPVPGASLTLVDADSGADAQVLSPDGLAAGSASVMSDARGEFSFGLAPPGRYRVRIGPPAPYSGPSDATIEALAAIGAFRITDGSYARAFTVSAPGPLAFDIPLDRSSSGLTLTKQVSVAVAEPGDRVLYTLEVGNADARSRSREVTITDQLPLGLRLITSSVRVSAGTVRSESDEGRPLRFFLPRLEAGERRTLRYLAEVRADARAGVALNRAQATDAAGVESPVADALLRIERDRLSQRMTIVGRITAGGCGVDAARQPGVGGVRVIMEDGSYTVTDPDGRYHLDSVRPGTHVVQIDQSTLPNGQVPVDCASSTRSAGSASSRFVRGFGGGLARADFHVLDGQSTARIAQRTLPRPEIASDAAAAGGEGAAWVGQPAAGSGAAEWLFPTPDANPRARVTRIVIRHDATQTVELIRDGTVVPALNFDGTSKDADASRAVSVWRGLELTGRDTGFTATIRNTDGSVADTLTRTVHFADTPVRATVLRDRSLLLADGISRPVIAVRLTDSAGRPLHHGATGAFSVPDPYLPAQVADALQARQLGGLERAPAAWHVEGDDGVAYIELEPTTASGSLTVTLPFRDGERQREERLDLWLDPGDRPWTVVGLAEGSAGFATLSDHLEATSSTDRIDGRLALYAKGRVQGRWLLTLAYDTDAEREDQRFGGVIDPTAYYTVYADGSQRRFDAASVRKLYLKLERPQFAALFGDYQTGIDRPQLTRYVRAFNGAQAQFDNGRVSATAFAADTAFRTRRAEIQGNGLSGPYSLGARALVPNGERVAIEVRDRLRSNIIVSRRELTRYLDYELDYETGVIRFREPITSRDLGLNPQFIVVDFESDQAARRVVNAGGRVGWRSEDGAVRAAATVIHDRDELGSADIVGADIAVRPFASTEVRAEVALSRGDRPEVGGNSIRSDATAWLVEAEHHTAAVDVLAYARSQGQGFGIGQQNRAERAATKIGLDGRVRLTNSLAASSSAYTEDYLDTSARRVAVRAALDWLRDGSTLSAGLVHVNDTTSTGDTRRSTLVELGGTQRLTNRLEVGAKAELALGGRDNSIDYPQRLGASARWRATNWVDLVGGYDLATGGSIRSGTARAGFELRPWTGARLLANANRQSIDERGTRSYASYGLAQSLPVTERLTVDATLDANTTFGRFDEDAVLNPDQPVAVGGFVDAGDILTEDFVAATLGASYRSERWSLVGRGELRRGSRTDRWGVTVSGIRQLGEGRSAGGRLLATSAEADTGTNTRNIEATAAIALRPAESAWSVLDRFDYREDRVGGAVLGGFAPAGAERLTVAGDAASRRLVNSLSINWTPRGERSGLELGEVQMFLGTRYSFERFDDLDIEGFSLLAGADAEFDLSNHVSVGGQANLRTGVGGDARVFSYGPRLTASPAQNTAVTLGYNVAGFRDRDFEGARATRDGVFVSARVKFDAGSFGGLFD